MRRPRRTSPELEALVERVDEWRKRAGGRGRRIPEEILADAITVARGVGVWATAKALRWNHTALQKRVKEAGGEGGGKSSVKRPGGGAVQSKRRKGRVVTRRPRAVAKGAAPGAVKIAKRALRAEMAPKKKTKPGFVEMGPLGGAGRAVIDLIGRHGERMRVEVAGAVDLAGVVHAFWSQKP